MNNAGSSLTRSIAEFIARPGFGSSSDAARAIAKVGLMDTVATALAGVNETVVGLVLRHAQTQGGALEAPLFWGGARMPSRLAALVNAVAGHALDYDDVSLSAHPSVVLVPALLAEAHRLGTSGRDVLDAYVVGFEVWAELFGREPDALHVKGWHPTSVLGTVGACAAVARLRRLPVDITQMALGIAASMSSGLVANFGTMTKPLHAGRAAASAIEAVELAMLGLTAAPDTLEHQAGFLAALSPKGRAARLQPFSINPDEPRVVSTGLSVKRYPVCYFCHRVIDGVLDLRAQGVISPEHVREVAVTIGDTQAATLRNHRPSNALEAKFSIEFAAAAALVAGNVGLAELKDDFVRRADVQALFERVRVETSPARCPVDPSFGFADRVRITCDDGSVRDTGEIRFPRGNAKNPMTAEELRQKFLDCVIVGGTGRDGAALYEKLSALDGLERLDSLFE